MSNILKVGKYNNSPCTHQITLPIINSGQSFWSVSTKTYLLSLNKPKLFEVNLILMLSYNFIHKMQLYFHKISTLKNITIIILCVYKNVCEYMHVYNVYNLYMNRFIYAYYICISIWICKYIYLHTFSVCVFVILFLCVRLIVLL